jgi:hypothetical protein
VPFDDYRNELTYESRLGDDIDAFAVSRAWYGYAQEPLPEPGNTPGSSKNIRDRSVQRTPRDLMRLKMPKMTTLFFRNYPARAQHYVATRLEEEGWFDDSGWVIPGWFEPEEGKLRDGKPLDGKFSDGSEPRIGQGHGKYAVIAWGEAFDMWRKHGDRNHLLFNPPTEEDKMRQKADRFLKRYNQTLDNQPQVPRVEDLSPEEREEFEAARYLWEYHFYRSQSNFPHFYNTARVEAEERTVKARKKFYDAEELRLGGSSDRALEEFQKPEGLPTWRTILRENKDFRNDTSIQEDTAEFQFKYLDLFNELFGRAYRQELAQRLVPMAVLGQWGQATVGPSLVPAWLAMAQTRIAQSGLFYLPAPGPFDVASEEGKPLLDPDNYRAVLERRGLVPKVAPEAPPPDLSLMRSDKPVERPLPAPPGPPGR